MVKPVTPLAAILVAACIATTDLISKAAIAERLAYGQQIELLPSLNIVYVINQGAAFGLLATAGGWQRYLFIIVAILASTLIFRMIGKPETGSAERIGLTMILGGAVGNLADRAARMGVVDWIDVYAGEHHWPAFNIADIGITVGTTVLLVCFLRGIGATSTMEHGKR